MRMGTELKQRLMSSLQSTIGSVYSLGWMSASETTATVTAEMETAGGTQDGPQTQPSLQSQQAQQAEEPTGPVSGDVRRALWADGWGRGRRGL